MPRDDFLQKTIDVLAKCVGFRCSNPSCRKLTCGPHSDHTKVLNIGVAGHITAAADGGPRYDRSLFPKERKSPDNGIWLCQTCAKLVDNDPSRYPVGVLRDWKKRAESKTLSELESMNAASEAASLRQLLGVQKLASYWGALQEIAEQPITPAVFTASRETEIAAVQKWLSGSPDSLFMQTDGLTDGLDFLAAVSASEDQDILRNALIIQTNEAWSQLTASEDSLILVAAPALQLRATDTAGAVAAGHYVFVSGTHGIISTRPAERLRRQDHYSVSEALVASKFSQSRAMSLAKASCGSSSILRRLITRHPESVLPSWCHEDVRSSLAPFALVGGWTHIEPDRAIDEGAPRIGSAPPLDLPVVAELVGCSRDDLEDIVTRWRQGAEPLFLRFGNSVLVSSREDAWYLLGGTITKPHLKRFSDMALLVLEEDNPALELDPDQRWMASLHGKTHSISEELRRSLIETLALMSTYPTADEPDPTIDFNRTVESILERVLPPAASWQRWASLGQNLTIVAEAAPDLFLRRVEEDLASENPELPKLFLDHADPMFGGGSLHCALLWSLEALAWSSEYLARVAKVLATLSARVPGVPSGNNPANSLREIFLLWLWHTNASLEHRMQALRTVIKVEPDVGWRLLRDLLPSGTSSVSHNTHMPRWQPWAEGWSRAKLQPQMFEYATAVANLTIDFSGTSPQRWSEVLVGLLQINDEVTNKVFSSLDGVCGNIQSNEEEAFSLWKLLRELLARHERYSDAQWAFRKEVQDHLEIIRDKLQPADAVLKHHWLFDYSVALPEPDPVKDHVAHDKALNEARINALREIVNQAHASGVMRLLGLASDASTVGWLIGSERLLDLTEMDVPAVFDSNDDNRLACINNYILSRYRHESWDFVNSIPLADWSAQHIATLARCLPFKADTWNWLGQFGSNVENAYWQCVRAYLRKPTQDELRRAAECLARVGRAFAAVDVLRSGLSQEITPPPDLVADILEAARSQKNTEDPNTTRDVARDTQKLIEYLQQVDGFNRERLARIEWGFLPILDREFCEVGPDTLVEMIDSEPQFYVDLLQLVYRAADEPRDECPKSEHDQLMASHASRLLGSLARLPGCNAEGEVDCESLRSWLQRVRSMASECKQLAICDFTLGQFVARATKRPEENWPSHKLAAVLEEVGTADLFDGFVNGTFNSRGVTCRNPTEGGRPERELVDRYRHLAEHARQASPKLAQAFQELAEHYEFDARREDEGAERRRLGR